MSNGRGGRVNEEEVGEYQGKERDEQGGGRRG